MTHVRLRHPYLDHPAPIPFAHRGGAADGLENTAAAFRRAAEAGYRYFETDVHATVDGKLVAFHDSTLDRVTDGQGRIAELPWKKIREARVGAPSRCRSSKTCWRSSRTPAGTSTSRPNRRCTRWST